MALYGSGSPAGNRRRRRDRAQAINALVQFGRLPGPLPIAVLADLDANVRVLGAKSAGDTTDPAVQAALGLALLADPSSNVRRAAAESATEAGSDLLPALSQAARNDPDPRVRLAALRAVTRFPESSAVGVDALDDQDPRLIDGIRWRTRAGVPWRDVPARYGIWQSLTRVPSTSGDNQLFLKHPAGCAGNRHDYSRSPHPSSDGGSPPCRWNWDCGASTASPCA